MASSSDGAAAHAHGHIRAMEAKRALYAARAERLRKALADAEREERYYARRVRLASETLADIRSGTVRARPEADAWADSDDNQKI